MKGKQLDLIKIYNELIETDDSAKAAQELTEGNVRGLAYALLNKTSLDDYERQDLMVLVKILQYIYNNSEVESPIPDISTKLPDYDSLYELNRKVNFTEVVGSINPQGRTVVSHRYPDLRGTLDKIHFYYEKDKGKEKNKKSMEFWFKQVLTKWLDLPLTPLREQIRHFSFDLMIMPKFDGVSIIIETDDDFICQRALSRGDTDMNEALDLSNIFKGINFEYLAEEYGIKKEMGVKLEVIMLRNKFKEYCSVYGKFNNPRSAVVSALKEKNGPDILKYLHLQPLRIQESNGTIHCMNHYSYTLKGRSEYPEFIEDIRVVSDEIIKTMDKMDIPRWCSYSDTK